jgi:hypothetical protein
MNATEWNPNVIIFYFLGLVITSNHMDEAHQYFFVSEATFAVQYGDRLCTHAYITMKYCSLIKYYEHGDGE